MGVMKRCVLSLAVFACTAPCPCCGWLPAGHAAAQATEELDASANRQSTSGAPATGKNTEFPTLFLGKDGYPCRIDCLVEQLDNSWVAELNEDPQAREYAPNTRAREVRSGHFVLVSPTPLPQPVLVATSREMAQELGLREVALQERRAVELLSGDVSAVPGFNVTWSTPYA
jgi:hypothetical protein